MGIHFMASVSAARTFVAESMTMPTESSDGSGDSMLLVVGGGRNDLKKV